MSAVATTLQEVTARLHAVRASQDKALGEIAAAKDEIAALATEVARLNEIIRNIGEGIPPEQLAELTAAVAAVEERAAAIDAALPDVVLPSDSPNAGDSPSAGDSPTAGDSPAAGDSPNAGDSPAADPEAPAPRPVFP